MEPGASDPARCADHADARGDTVIDEVRSYTALRSVTISRDRFMLNGRPYLLRLVLDQGYWPDTLMAAPSDDALRRDVELAKAMGFNGVRKHQKIEDPRYLYWADRLGLLVWEEMPSAYRFTRIAITPHGARMDRSDRARLQPSLRHRLGAVQRVVGRAGADRRSGAAPRGRGAVPPDPDARRDPPGDRQRRLGKQRDRHHRHPRLRRRTRSTSRQRYGTEIDPAEPVRPAPARRTHPDPRRLSRIAASRSC